MHELGVAHRDIKPDNILVSLEPQQEDDELCPTDVQLKICDFGSAKILDRHNEAVKNHKAMETLPKGSVTYISTRYYRAPELLLGNQYYGVEIDLWAAGCVLAELYSKVRTHTYINQQGKQTKSVSCTLFKGNSNLNQLQLIIDLLGTPDSTQMAEINPFYNSEMF
jgi:serine/threonine protein kinase